MLSSLLNLIASDIGIILIFVYLMTLLSAMIVKLTNQLFIRTQPSNNDPKTKQWLYTGNSARIVRITVVLYFFQLGGFILLALTMFTVQLLDISLLIPKVHAGDATHQEMNLNRLLAGWISIAIIFFHLTALVSIYYFLFAQEKSD